MMFYYYMIPHTLYPIIPILSLYLATNTPLRLLIKFPSHIPHHLLRHLEGTNHRAQIMCSVSHMVLQVGRSLGVEHKREYLQKVRYHWIILSVNCYWLLIDIECYWWSLSVIIDIGSYWIILIVIDCYWFILVHIDSCYLILTHVDAHCCSYSLSYWLMLITCSCSLPYWLMLIHLFTTILTHVNPFLDSC